MKNSGLSYEERRRAAILKAAREQFIKNGYGGTSLDSIVEIVGGSKSTIYSYFGNKEQLFIEVVRRTGHDADNVHLPLDCDDGGETLKAFARNRLKQVLSQENIRIMRLVISEAERFPKIGQVYFEHAPTVTYERLAVFMEAMDKRGLLNAPDAELAAEKFLGPLIMRPLLARLYRVMAMPSAAEISKLADKHVRDFLNDHKLTN